MQKAVKAVLLLIVPVCAGGAVFAVCLVHFIDILADSEYRGVFPGEARFRIDDPGTYTIWHYTYAIEGGEVFNRSQLPHGTKIDVLYQGDAVDPETNVAQTMEMGDETAVAVAKFRIDRAGEVVLRASSPGDDRFVLAVAKAGFIRAFFTLFAGIAALGVGGVIGLVLMIVCLVKTGGDGREKFRRFDRC